MINRILGLFSALFLFGAFSEAVEAQGLGRVMAGLTGLFLTSMALVFLALITGFAFRHPLATEVVLFGGNALAVANLMRQGNPDSGLLGRGLTGALSTIVITPLSAYATLLLIALIH